MNTTEFSLRTKSKWAMVFLFLMVGGPMMYAAYLNYSGGELFFSVLMVILFFVWAIVILIAIGFKISLTKHAIHRQGLFSPSIIDYADVKAIHFGSAWSNFYVESKGGKKIFFGKDFERYQEILHGIVQGIDDRYDIREVQFMGDPENIQRYTAPLNPKNE
ncbi:MAG: hypothetical protein ACQEST_11565 [Bacteroidota bacterium]